MASKIKVDTIENVAGSGNVSLGSGHNLVVPGNITGQGTAAITSNATVGGTLGVTGKTTLSDNVGIGVTTETDWHANNEVLQLGLGACIYGNNTATENQILANAKGTLGSSLNGYKYINADKASTYQQYDGQHNFRVAGAGSADAAITWNTAMTIDNSGVVTKPNTPAFKTGVDNRNATGSDRVLSTTNGDTFTYQTRDKHNVGSHFSESTGRFTCPVAGTYMFYCSLMRNGNNGTVLENRIKKNGGLMFARAYAGAYTAQYQQSMLVTTSVCAINDYIEFFVQGTVSIYQDDTYIGGYLIG